MFTELPQWLQLIFSAIGGAALATGVFGRMFWQLDKRVQKIENYQVHANDLIDTRISNWWHEVRAPSLQLSVYGPIDKMEEEQKKQGQNVAILLERDRISTLLERILLTSQGPRPRPASEIQQPPPQS